MQDFGQSCPVKQFSNAVVPNTAGVLAGCHLQTGPQCPQSDLERELRLGSNNTSMLSWSHTSIHSKPLELARLCGAATMHPRPYQTSHQRQDSAWEQQQQQQCIPLNADDGGWLDGIFKEPMLDAPMLFACTLPGTPSDAGSCYPMPGISPQYAQQHLITDGLSGSMQHYDVWQQAADYAAYAQQQQQHQQMMRLVPEFDSTCSAATAAPSGCTSVGALPPGTGQCYGSYGSHSAAAAYDASEAAVAPAAGTTTSPYDVSCLPHAAVEPPQPTSAGIAAPFAAAEPAARTGEQLQQQQQNSIAKARKRPSTGQMGAAAKTHKKPAAAAVATGAAAAAASDSRRAADSLYSNLEAADADNEVCTPSKGHSSSCSRGTGKEAAQGAPHQGNSSEKERSKDYKKMRLLRQKMHVEELEEQIAELTQSRAQDRQRILTLVQHQNELLNVVKTTTLKLQRAVQESERLHQENALAFQQIQQLQLMLQERQLAATF